ncbi:uncharacterized protein [Nicotiana tomentosiformis]|uniref:uncharacterized protein n=1 Tax=Nicotiana tomentosiformis TaxID=4098 RepID=UPI00388CBF29
MYQQLSNPPPYPSHGPSSSNNEMGRIENMFKKMMEKNANSVAQLASHNTSISVTTISGRGGNAPTSSQRKLVDDEQVIEEEEIPNNVVQENDEVRIAIVNTAEDTQEEVNPFRDHIIDTPKPVVQKAKAPLPKPPLPYSQRLAKQNGENQFKKYIDMMKSLSINVPLVEDLEKMPGYAKFMKDLVTRKPSMNFETIKVDSTLAVLHKRKKAIGWTLEDIWGISPTFCMHEINLEEDAKPSIEHQRRLNEAMQDVVKKKIIKWLDAKVVYLISDSSWTYPVQCVPKKGSMIVVTNDKDKLIPIRTVTGWRVCMNYRKLNKVMRKDHVSIPFLDQILDRLAERAFYYFTDRYSGYNQILIAPEDQEKITFTCPYGPFAFKWMPFGLCNAPMTFQRCMMAIFMDMVEDYLEVFMDEFSVVGDSFYDCLENLDRVLARCQETNLVLNWEKCHFMVEGCIVLGHKISKNGIEVYKAKIEVISKLSPPTSVKGVRSFLGHARFYRHFIKDFSKVVNPLCKLLEKGVNFHFNDDFMRVPWFADLANFLVCGIIPDEFSSNPRKKLKRGCQDYYWDKPYLFRICTDGVIRRYVPDEEQNVILEACHSLPYGGHHGGARTVANVLSCGFYWPTPYKEASDMVKRCGECQRAGGISKKNEMPLTTILEIDIFDMWGIEFMGPFVRSCGNTYILVAIDYVSKWVDSIALPNNEARSVVAIPKKIILT